MKSTTKKTTAIVLALALICSMFAGCGKAEPAPKDTIFALQEAINSFDLDALLSCLDSSLAEQIRTVLRFTVGDGDISVETFFTLVKSILPILPLVSEGAIQKDDIPQVTLTVLETQQQEDTAVVSLEGVLNWGSYSKTFSAAVDMRLENGMWVICGIQ